MHAAAVSRLRGRTETLGSGAIPASDTTPLSQRLPGVPVAAPGQAASLGAPPPSRAAWEPGAQRMPCLPGRAGR